MTEYLVYWRYYWEDQPAESRRFGWASASQRFYGVVEPGDTFWVVIRGGPENPEEWRLLARSVISRKYIDPAGDDEYGRYMFAGDPRASKRWKPNELGDMTQTLKSLEFATGKKIAAEGARIGQALQSQRRLTVNDARRLRKFASLE